MLYERERCGMTASPCQIFRGECLILHFQNTTNMYTTLKPVLEQELAEIEKAGLYKRERIITSPQRADITVQGGKHVINFCANNYLGLSSHPKVIAAAKAVKANSDSFSIAEMKVPCGVNVPTCNS